MKIRTIACFMLSLVITLCIGAIANADDNIHYSYKLADNDSGDMSIFAVTNIYKTSVLHDSAVQNIENALNNAIENVYRDEFSVEVNIPYQNNSERQAILNDVWIIAEKCLNENPLWFTVDRDRTKEITDPNTGQTSLYVDYMTIRYTTAWDNDAVASLYFVFNFEDDAEDRLSEFKNAADNVIAYMNSQGVTSNSPDFDKALWLHDYLAVNSEYETDYALPTALRSAYDNLVLHKSVCEGYACAYKYLLSLVGVECKNVYNTTAAHEWSLVKADGKWYHVDVTHDDPLSDFVGKVAHHHFLRANDDILGGIPMSSGACNMHSQWFTADGYTSETTDDTFADTAYAADAAWRDTKSSIAFVGDYRYYIRYDAEHRFTFNGGRYTGCAKIVKCDKDMNILDDTYFQILSPWYTSAGNSYYQDYYTGLGAYGSNIYYNTYAELMQIDTTAKTPAAQPVYTHMTTLNAANQIFGSYVDTNRLYYGIVNFPDLQTIFSDRKYITLADPSAVTVTFNSGGGSAVSSQVLQINQKASEPDAPTKTGHVFEGWYTDEDKSNKYDFDTKVIEDMTLYAKWTPASTPTPEPTLEPGIYPYTIKDISIMGNNGEPFSSIPVNSSFIVNVTILKTDVRNKWDYVIAACYDSEEKLVSLSYTLVNPTQNSEYPCAIPVRPSTGNSISEMSVFIWNSFGAQMPLTEKAIFSSTSN